MKQTKEQVIDAAAKRLLFFLGCLPDVLDQLPKGYYQRRVTQTRNRLIAVCKSDQKVYGVRK